MSHDKSKPFEQKAHVEPKASDADILSSKLHGNVYQVPSELKKWFEFKGKKIYSEGREQWLSPDVVTWDEVRDGQRTYQGDDYDQAMFNDLRKYCYSERYKSQIANPSVLDESTGKSYQIPANYKQWFNQNRLAIEDASVDEYSTTSQHMLYGRYDTDAEPQAYNNYNTDSESKLYRTEKINGVVTLKQLRSFCDNSPSGSDNHKKLITLDDSFYRQRFKSKTTQATVAADNGYVYQVPQNLKAWFDQNRCNIEKTGRGTFDGTVTAGELSTFSILSPDGCDTRKNVDTLFRSFYNQRFKSQIAESTVFGDNGFVHKLPGSMKPWFDQQRILFESVTDVNQWDGKITTPELIAYYKNVADSDERTKLTDLLHHCYQQRFKQVNLLNERDGTTYELPKHLQKWLNQNGWATDMMDGEPDGKVTLRELQESPEQTNSNNYEMMEEFKTFVENTATNKYNALQKSFEAQVSKDPKALKSWFEKNKGAIDLDNNGSITDRELMEYESSNKLNAYDKTMVLGLHGHAKAFSKMTDHKAIPNADFDNRDATFTSGDINAAVKLALHQVAPAQVAFDNSIEATKQGAIYGAMAGGAIGLLRNIRSTVGVISSWGFLSESAMGAIGTTTGRTIGGAILGALAGAAITAGIEYGLNYYQSNNRLTEKNKELRTAHLMN